MPAVITTGATIVGAGFTGCSSGIFKVWCLGNNVYEKYAFTFIQHSRSTFWLISTEAYNPEASKCHLLLRRFHGSDPSYKMGRVSFCSGTNRPLVPSARAQDMSMLRKMSQRSKPEHGAHGCLRHGEQRHLCSVLLKAISK